MTDTHPCPNCGRPAERLVTTREGNRVYQCPVCPSYRGDRLVFSRTPDEVRRSMAEFRRAVREQMRKEREP
jgi:uncharacterized Zn finger protein